MGVPLQRDAPVSVSERFTKCPCPWAVVRARRASHALFMALACDSRHRWVAGADQARWLRPKESRGSCTVPAAKLCHGVLQLFLGRGTAQNSQHLQDGSCQQDETRSDGDSHGKDPCQICSLPATGSRPFPQRPGENQGEAGTGACQCLGLLRQSVFLELGLDIQTFF